MIENDLLTDMKENLGCFEAMADDELEALMAASDFERYNKMDVSIFSK